MRLLLLLAFLVASAASAEGPGTRIRSSSQIPQPPQMISRDATDACARLKREARERCLNDARRPVKEGRSTGADAADGATARDTGSSGAATPR